MGIWTDELDKTWLEELVYQAIGMGKKSHSGFKREAWSEVLKKLNNTHNLERTMAQLKSRYDTIKGMYGIVLKLANSSGMGWESSRCRVECLSITWDEMLAGKPKSWRAWQNRSFPQFALCETLFRGTLATGSFASASSAPLNQAYGDSVDINYNDDNAMDNNDQPDDASSNDEESLNNVDTGRARQSAQTEERPPPETSAILTGLETLCRLSSCQ
ncbi:hypothetical protein DYB37_012651 [Aphanomyces astaci]|uniref:Myb/SANT-like domain-containing protein n=1 Tax=Aphanomyces astaci TaxID=112090 RepID=A0A3R7EH70_APHAT|nr:hypothetical protein DYB35_012525 [Aphanomyces astaci]RHZ33220.1 hypothetical protein DYB37_012651 [Aphanomyces astaci]